MNNFNVVAIAPYERPWSNVELVKDCGLIPYLLYKNHGCNVTMVGAKPDAPYEYASLIEGVEFFFLPDGKLNTKIDFIDRNASNIDLLILRGSDPNNIVMGTIYKQANPSGKIYIGLDANSHWFDRVSYKTQACDEFFPLCDMTATSCREMAKNLNQKYPWKVEFIPNGYYDFSHSRPAPDYSKKENIILTVQRIGSDQKRTDILLDAFALAAPQIPDYKLMLIGSIEPEFQAFIDDYFINHPELKDRVIFVGQITNREELFSYYLRAKIFSLTSDVEGGTPNVIADALYAGCALALTAFDGCFDATNYGKCGECVGLVEEGQLSQALIKLSTSPELITYCQNSYQNGIDNFDMNKIVEKIYERIFRI